MAGGAPQHLKISFSWFLMVASFWESDVFSIFSIDNPLDIMNCMYEVKWMTIQKFNIGSKSDMCRCILLRLIHVPYFLLRINVPMS